MITIVWQKSRDNDTALFTAENIYAATKCKEQLKKALPKSVFKIVVDDELENLDNGLLKIDESFDLHNYMAYLFCSQKL